MKKGLTAKITKRSEKSVFDFMNDLEASTACAKGYLKEMVGDNAEQLKLARIFTLTLNDIITESTKVNADLAAKVIGLCDISFCNFWDEWEKILEHGDEIYSRTFFREFVCHEMGYSRMKKAVFIGIERLGWGDWKQYIFKFGRKVMDVDFSDSEGLKLNLGVEK